MVRTSLRLVYALGTLALVACGRPSIEEQVRAEGLAPASIVRLAEDRAVAARRDASNVRVVELRGESGEWVVEEIASSEHGGGASAHLLTAGGETDDEWNSFFYGTAPPAVSRVLVDGFDPEGGQVVDGAWVLVLPDKDLVPGDMHWQFIDAFGQIIDSGTGIFPAD